MNNAIEALQNTIARTPTDPRPHIILATILFSERRVAEALSTVDHALQLQPGLAKAHQVRGDILAHLGRSEEALLDYQRVISLEPNEAASYINPGILLAERGRHRDAEKLFRAAVALHPEFFEAHFNLGSVLLVMGRLEESIAALSRAAVLQPNNALCQNMLADAHLKLGIAHHSAGRLDEAAESYRQAIVLRPDHADSHFHLAQALKETGQIEQAIPQFRRTVQLRPDLTSYQSALLTHLYYHPDLDAKSIYAEHVAFDAIVARPLAPADEPKPKNPSTQRRLRIGYVSPDFKTHSTSQFSLPLLRAHDRNAFEIFCYSDVAKPDVVTRKLQGCADVWRDLTGKSDEEAASIITKDAIDILVDLALHTPGGRPLLFARKPAPIQVSWLGYPGTTGLSAIEYRLTDPYLDPPAVSSVEPAGLHDEFYSERSIRLPDTCLCFDPMLENLEPGPLPMLANGFVTFGSLNSISKTNDETLRRWAEVLRGVQNSRMLIMAPAGKTRERVAGIFASVGVSPQRLEFIGRQPTRRQVVEIYRRIDIALDTFPWNGHTTSFEALWMGVPVVSLHGQTGVSRAGLCYLSNLALDDLATPSPERFVTVARELAGDVERLKSLRASLRPHMERSPLMNAPMFARNIEAAYLSMWRSWERKSSTT